MDIRKEFLEFFQSKGHKIYPSISLVPNDDSLLFTNAGMVQFKDIFTGEIPIPNPPRATSSQVCLRAGGKHNDLENVGYTARHHTMFEMLGNFSFGDYFKDKAIEYAWEFVTEILKLPKEKLWVTVHIDDDEAFEIWKKFISEDRIKRFDEDNFWAMGDTGPCGPCSEIFYDQGKEHFNSKEDYLGGDGDRFLEIWNLVFMQYERDKDGTLTPLPKPSIDTGMGLERIVAIKEGVFNNFDSSIFKPILNKIEEIVKNSPSTENIGSFRVIADHIRAIVFLVANGVLFDKVGRGYVARRILRRAIRHGYLLGIKKPFMYKLVDSVKESMSYHRDIFENIDYIKEQILLEEERFFKTIEAGMELFFNELKNTKDIFSGKVAFMLYDTHGFPLDLTIDMLREKNIKLDIDEFNKYMQEQKDRAKKSWKGSGDNIEHGDFKLLLEKFGKNKFVGYTKTKHNSKILALLDDNFKITDTISSTGWVMIEETPFYAQSGGQVGDKGIIEEDNFIAEVIDTQKFYDINLSQIKIIQGEIKTNTNYDLVVVKRNEIAKHHSATHLLQSALKMVLGKSVSQAGSLNTFDRLRFDFTYSKALTKEQLDEIEDLVNSMIAHSIEADIKEMPIEEAKKTGAISLFGEKYGDIVRVVKFGDVSVEFCGGTHVKNTAEIGSFYITKETGVSSGVRRIEAVCGMSAIKFAKENIDLVNNLKAKLKTNDISLSIDKFKKEIKELKQEIKNLQNKSQKQLKIQDIKDVKVIVDEIENGDIKSIIDKEKNRYEKVAIFLFQKSKDKVLIACGTKGIDVKASDWIKNIAPIVAGGGGGRDDFAQAGGKDISKIPLAKEKALEFIKSRLDG